MSIQRVLFHSICKTIIFSVIVLLSFKVSAKAATPIYTVEDLYAINNDLSGDYILMNDLDLSGTKAGGEWDFGGGWDPIGNDTYTPNCFSGTFDGNGHFISNMNIFSGNTDSYLGLFYCNFGEIKNLGMKNVSIITSNDDYIRGAGAIAGCCKGTIHDCFATGKIAVNLFYSNSVDGAGGITGKTINEIRNCYTDMELSSNGYVGGIAGINDSNYYITNCYAVGEVKGAAGNTGMIIGRSTGYTAYNCYYLSSNGSDKYAKGLSTLQMQKQGVWTGFDFDEEWVIDPYSEYLFPQLQKCVQERILTVELVSSPTKTEYYTTDTELDLTGGILRVTYESGRSVDIPLDQAKISYVLNYGTQTVTAEWKGKTVTFLITVKKNTGSIAGTSSYEGIAGNSIPLDSKSNSDGALSFSSSDKRIATVTQSGIVTLHTAGTVSITVSLPETANYTSAEMIIVITVKNPDYGKDAMRSVYKKWIKKNTQGNALFYLFDFDNNKVIDCVTKDVNAKKIMVLSYDTLKRKVVKVKSFKYGKNGVVYTRKAKHMFCVCVSKGNKSTYQFFVLKGIKATKKQEIVCVNNAGKMDYKLNGKIISKKKYKSNMKSYKEIKKYE